MRSFSSFLYVALDAAELYVRIGLGLTSVGFLLIFLGVMIPAVWSTKPERRRAAFAVLVHILNALVPPVSLTGTGTPATDLRSSRSRGELRLVRGRIRRRRPRRRLCGPVRRLHRD